MSESFGERLKNLRKAAGLTQSQLAEIMNVHLQTVSKWERNVSEPDISLLGETASSLRVPLERLVGAPESDRTYTGAFDASAFGKNLSAVRKRCAESQEIVAAAADTTPDIVSKWERGVVCPNIGQLLRLAEHFSLSVSRLYYAVSE